MVQTTRQRRQKERWNRPKLAGTYWPPFQAQDTAGCARQAAVRWLDAHTRELAVQPECMMVWTRN